MNELLLPCCRCVCLWVCVKTFKMVGPIMQSKTIAVLLLLWLLLFCLKAAILIFHLPIAWCSTIVSLLVNTSVTGWFFTPSSLSTAAYRIPEIWYFEASFFQEISNTGGCCNRKQWLHSSVVENSIQQSLPFLFLNFFSYQQRGCIFI